MQHQEKGQVCSEDGCLLVKVKPRRDTLCKLGIEHTLLSSKAEEKKGKKRSWLPN